MKKRLPPYRRKWTETIVLYIHENGKSHGSKLSRDVKKSQPVIYKQLNILAEEGFVIHSESDGGHGNSNTFVLTNNGNLLANYFIDNSKFNKTLQKRYGGILK